MNYFFDLINEISGYTHKYHEETKLNHEELIAKYRSIKNSDGFDSPLLADDYPHSVMVIESLQNL